MKLPLHPAFVNQALVYTLVALGFSGTIGVGTVWMQHQISLVANANKLIEARIAALERQTEQATTEIAEEQDAGALQRRNLQWQLGLVPPRREQITAVTGDPASHLRAKNNRELLPPGPAPAERIAWQH